MKLYGHGKVTVVYNSSEDRRVLRMNWNYTEKVLDLPLMGCNSTVNLKKPAVVLREIPLEFHEWLSS